MSPRIGEIENRISKPQPDANKRELKQNQKKVIQLERHGNALDASKKTTDVFDRISKKVDLGESKKRTFEDRDNALINQSLQSIIDNDN